MLLEDRRRLGLVYRDRSSLYTQEPALTLVYGQPGLAPPLKPVDDDKETRNDRTIVRDGGSSARAVLEAGRLSVQPPPNGIGLYDDSQTLSLAADTQAEPIAYWQLHLGTYDGARYPAVRLLLHNAPHLIPAVLRLREGDLLRLTNLPPWVAFGDVDLIVTGWSETLKPRTWERTFVCAAAWPVEHGEGGPPGLREGRCGVGHPRHRRRHGRHRADGGHHRRPPVDDRPGRDADPHRCRRRAHERDRDRQHDEPADVHRGPLRQRGGQGA